MKKYGLLRLAIFSSCGELQPLAKVFFAHRASSANSPTVHSRLVKNAFFYNLKKNFFSFLLKIVSSQVNIRNNFFDQKSSRHPEVDVLRRHRQTDRQTDGHGDSMIESAQRADSAKILRIEKVKMLCSYFCHIRRFVFDQSSLVHPVSESRGGGSTSLTYERTDERKSFCLIFDHC